MHYREQHIHMMFVMWEKVHTHCLNMDHIILLVIILLCSQKIQGMHFEGHTCMNHCSEQGRLMLYKISLLYIPDENILEHADHYMTIKPCHKALDTKSADVSSRSQHTLLRLIQAFCGSTTYTHHNAQVGVADGCSFWAAGWY